MKKKLFNLLSIIVLFGCSLGILWISTSCSDDITIENPTGSGVGAVNVRIDLNTFDTDAPLPGLFAGGGVCFDRTISGNGSSNILCKSSSSPRPYSLSPLLDQLKRDEVLLQIQVQGDNQFFQEFLYTDSQIQTNSAGDCVVRIAAPLDQSSKIKVRILDKCCSSSSAPRRVEWMSKMGDQQLILSSSVPTTGSSVVTRTAKLIPIGLFSPQSCN